MAEIRTLQEVKNSMRKVFATAAGIADPMLITDDSKLYDSPPPPGDLALAPPPAPAMASLLTLASRDLLGAKVAALFERSLVPPDMDAFTTFGPLAESVHRRVNDLARRGLALACCRALERDPDDVSLSTAIKHPNAPGALTFAHRLSHELAATVCNAPGFSLTPAQLQDATKDMTVGEAVDLLAKVLSKGGCL